MKPQKYNFTYKVLLKNKSGNSKGCQVLIPLPAISINEEFSGKAPERNIDKKYGNKYCVCNKKIESGGKSEISYSFDCNVKPGSLVNSDKKWVFKDYEIKEEERKYLNSNSYITSDNKEIKRMAHKIRGHEENVVRVLKRVSDYIIEDLDYGNPLLGLYSAEEALMKKRVDCGGFSTLFVSFAITLGVPCRIVSGFWAGYGKSTMHAWAEFMLPDGKWVPVDLSIQQLARRGRTMKSGRFGFVGSDRVIMSYGCDIPVIVNGKRKSVDILQNPYVYSDGDSSDVEVELVCMSKRIK